jgi:TPR repeat protein
LALSLKINVPSIALFLCGTYQKVAYFPVMSAKAPRSWEQTQISVFTKWCNVKLKQRGVVISSVCTDFADGVNLIRLLEVVSEKEFTIKWHQQPKLRVQMIENCNLAVAFIKNTMGIKLVAIGGPDIVDKNVKLTLGLIWSVIANTHIDAVLFGAVQEGQSSKDALLAWCRETIKDYERVNITDFSKSWASGLALNALVHRFFPDVVEYESLLQADQKIAIAVALRAIRHLEIGTFLEIEDLDVDQPDEKAVITQVAELYRCLIDPTWIAKTQRRLNLTQVINEKINDMIAKSDGFVNDVLVRMKNGLMPLTYKGDKKYCPVCEELFDAICGLFNGMLNEVVAMRNRVQELSNVVLQQRDAEITALRTQLQELNDVVLKDSEREIDELREKFKELTETTLKERDAEIASLQKQLQEGLETSQRDMDMRIQVMSTKIQEQDDTNANQSAEISRLKSIIAELEKSHRDKERDASEKIRGLVAQSEQLRHKVQDGLQKEAEKVKHLQSKLDRYEGKIGMLEKELSEERANHAKRGRDDLIEGLKLEYGHGILKNEARAFVAYKRSAEHGDSEGLFSLARMFERGSGTVKNLGEAVAKYEAAVALKHYGAMNNLGVMRLKGIEAEKNEVEAARLFREAADNGIGSAQFNYSILLDQGVGVPKNAAESSLYLRRAAAAGHPKALNNLAVRLKNGFTPPQAGEDIQNLWRQSGVPCALFNLGLMSKEESSRNALWKKSAERGCPAALNNYGVLMMKGEGFPENPAKGASLFKQAADAGNSEAFANYATVLMKGKGVALDMRGAMILLKKASQMGVSFAMTNFGVQLATGKHVRQNLEKAITLIRDSAERGEPFAEFNYGLMLLYGIGMDRPSPNGMRYLTSAAKKGVDKANMYIRRGLQRTRRPTDP